MGDSLKQSIVKLGMQFVGGQEILGGSYISAYDHVGFGFHQD